MQKFNRILHFHKLQFPILSKFTIKPIIMENKSITRKEALKKIEKYGKYMALTAMGTYLILQPKQAQAASPVVPGTGF